MPIDRPTPDALTRIAARLGFEFTREELQALAGFADEMKASYDVIDAVAEPAGVSRYPRDAGRKPPPEHNRFNEWSWKVHIPGAPVGPLAGKRIAVKDNVCVAGVPMGNGSPLLDDYIPEADATVVTRVLDAGATIVGKAACENLCLSGASHTSRHGAVRNPHDNSRSSGGSSSGCAAALAGGAADMAIGGDQGGSIRIPAAWSGVVGLKPTYGLVPYTGIFPIERTLDHCGPMARSVAEVAELLAVIAGPDGHDSRQVDVRVGDYAGAIRHGDASGMRVGLVVEGFGHSRSEPLVDAQVEAAAHRLREAGAEVLEVSIPMHRLGYHIWSVILLEGSADVLFRGCGAGTNWQGRHPTSLVTAYGRALRARPNDFPDTGKLNVLMSEFVRERHGTSYYAKAQNLRPLLRQAYDQALSEVDVLVMPTVPFRATALPAADAPLHDRIARARDGIDANTAPFDASGHPALSVPCGAPGLPIGMMLAGRYWDEASVLRAAQSVYLSRPATSSC